MPGNATTGTSAAIDVRTLRERSGLAQEEFARRFGLSFRTVQQWEQGRRVPDGPARILLRIIDRDAAGAEHALWGPQDYTVFRQRVEDVRSLVAEMVPTATFSERHRDIPCWRLESERLVTMGFDFWPFSSRSCILVDGAEHAWFDIADPVLPMAEYVVRGLVGPAQPPPMTFKRYVEIADHAMRSIAGTRARVELRGDPAVDSQVLWDGEYVAVALQLVEKDRVQAQTRVEPSLPSPPPMDDFLLPGSAVRFGAYLATVLTPPRRR